MSLMPLGMGGAGTSTAIDILVQEMKALRQDMNSGKIRTNTYLDGQKVTTGIAVASEQSTRNNFSYGQRLL
jgi:ABC-type multidrug transport system ATPase subunit